jgi:hypothetical protein
MEGVLTFSPSGLANLACQERSRQLIIPLVLRPQFFIHSTYGALRNTVLPSSIASELSLADFYLGAQPSESGLTEG